MLLSNDGLRHRPAPISYVGELSDILRGKRPLASVVGLLKRSLLPLAWRLVTANLDITTVYWPDISCCLTKSSVVKGLPFPGAVFRLGYLHYVAVIRASVLYGSECLLIDEDFRVWKPWAGTHGQHRLCPDTRPQL